MVLVPPSLQSPLRAIPDLKKRDRFALPPKRKSSDLAGLF